MNILCLFFRILRCILSYVTGSFVVLVCSFEEMWKKPKPDSPKIVVTVSGEKMLMGVGVLEQKVESISFLRSPV